jgi:benzoyl-CoA reductase/2-hydroxyglutaryl-CoA dehydratase subunit BcrC/BadD/HgdB
MPSIFVDIPKKNDELSAWYFYEELKKLRRFFEELNHSSITDSVISISIERYNENRQLLSELYELRARFPSLLKSELLISVLDANVTLSTERANSLLRSLCDDIRQNASTRHEKVMKKVFVSGNIFDALPLLRFIEECGGQITGDDFCFGGRYAQTRIQGTDPLYALAQGYLKKMPCGRMEDYSRRFDFILEEMEKHGTRGLIYSSLKFCDNFLVDYPALKEKLDGFGIPSLFLEGEYFSLNTGQIKTRIEAFIEML